MDRENPCAVRLAVNNQAAALVLSAVLAVNLVGCGSFGSSVKSPIDQGEKTDCGPAAARTVWPQLTAAQPTQVAPGGTVTITGSGGYRQWDPPCGPAYDESSRPFALSLDGRAVDPIVCYVNHCEVRLTLPTDLSPGVLVISVEGGSRLTATVVSR